MSSSDLSKHLRFLRTAEFIAKEFSKDPDKQVGALVVSPDRRSWTPGYNGLPAGIADTPERLNNRAYKLRRTIHAEVNALFNCPTRPVGHTLYVWPIPPCDLCAGVIIQNGIAEVWAPAVSLTSSWYDSCNEGRELLEEAGINSNWI